MLALELVRELAAVAVEELDAVVLIAVVRGADDHAEVAAEALRHVGDAGRRQRTDQQHVHAGGDESRLERGFEHVAGDARVLADEYAAAVRREHARGGARELAGRNPPSSAARPPGRAPRRFRNTPLNGLSRPCTALDHPDGIARRRHIVRAHAYARPRPQPRPQARGRRPAAPAAGRPSTRPMVALARHPDQERRARAPRDAPRFLSNARLCSCRLPKPKPGSSAIGLRRNPRREAGRALLAQEGSHLADHVMIVRVRPAWCAARPACASGTRRLPPRPPIRAHRARAARARR